MGRQRHLSQPYPIGASFLDGLWMYSQKDYKIAVGLLFFLPCTCIRLCAELSDSLDRPITVLYRSRDIEANSIRSFRRPHRATAIVPSLGSVADQILDGLGYPSSAIPLLHMAYINALRSRGQRSMFVHVMANRGMSLMEAAMFWNLIELPGGMSFDYRVRIDIPQD